jgi:prepilin-type N-terminal cleavage/methylation domain-containing protein
MRGFSLVELSIVLVILGLLTGGILTGQNLIRAAELRSIVSDFQRYQTATQTFRDKYFAMPGDMSNAEDFWGAMSSGTCPSATGGVGTETCNGDGNGHLDDASAASVSGEEFTYWQHMANAGMIEGTYTGIAGSGGVNHDIPGENSPPSKVTNAAFGVDYRDGTSGSTSDFPLQGHRIWFGAAKPNNHPNAAALLPEEAWNIDKKLDDGQPGKGKIMTWKNATLANCTTTDDETTSEYNLSYSSTACAIFLLNGF